MVCQKFDWLISRIKTITIINKGDSLLLKNMRNMYFISLWVIVFFLNDRN